MGCRKKGFPGQESSVPASLSDALIIATMCIIGLPVDVHVKDGSIYSGILHTACVENDYGIVLKKARMTKKGDGHTNVASEDQIETLVIQSEDLVQVVAKGISLPADGVAYGAAGDSVGDIVGHASSLECAERGVKMKNSSKIHMDRVQNSQTRRSFQTENGTACGFTPTTVNVGNALQVENGNSAGIHSVKKEECSSAVKIMSQVGDGRSQLKQFDYLGKSNLQTEETASEVQGSGLSFEAGFTQSKNVEEVHQDTASKHPATGASSRYPPSSIVKLNGDCQERHLSEDSLLSNDISLGVSTSGPTSVECAKVYHVCSSSTPTEMVPPKSTSSTSTEFKLNPGARVFRPLSANQRSVTPPAVPTVANLAYVPDNFPMVPVATAQPEVEVSSFVPRPSLPVKFVPYGHLTAGNGINDTQYSQSIVGHVGSRPQPTRYAVQHHPMQAGPAYMHASSQNVVVGRFGQLVYMHPVSHDVNQGVAAVSPVATRPLLTLHHGHLPKHQGSAAAQTLQLCLTPPFIDAGQQPFAMQSHIPLSQPPFPVIRPIAVPGSNSIFSAKFP